MQGLSGVFVPLHKFLFCMFNQIQFCFIWCRKPDVLSLSAHELRYLNVQSNLVLIPDKRSTLHILYQMRILVQHPEVWIFFWNIIILVFLRYIGLRSNIYTRRDPGSAVGHLQRGTAEPGRLQRVPLIETSCGGFF